MRASFLIAFLIALVLSPTQGTPASFYIVVLTTITGFIQDVSINDGYMLSINECVSISLEGAFREGDKLSFSDDDCQTFLHSELSNSFCRSSIEVTYIRMKTSR